MIVRSSLAVLFAAIALLLGACGGGGNSSAVEETSDPLYQQALDLNKQGRKGEALNAFLKLIDRRGENGAPESHLEAGNLYLNWSKDPVEAYHHFSKYLELQPVGPRSDMVRGQRLAAQRELVRLLPGPSGEQGVEVNNSDEVEQLRRRVHELEAEVQTLRGSTSVPVVRSAPVIAMPPDEGAEAPKVPQIPIASAGPATEAPQSDAGFMRGFAAATPSPAATRPQPAPTTTTSRPTNAATSNPRPTAPATQERVATTPTRPGTTARPTAPAGGAHRTHTVGPRESLWAIARRYYGPQVTNAQVQGIYQANRDTMRSASDLRAGMVLRIP